MPVIEDQGDPDLSVPGPLPEKEGGLGRRAGKHMVWITGAASWHLSPQLGACRLLGRPPLPPSHQTQPWSDTPHPRKQSLLLTAVFQLCNPPGLAPSPSWRPGEPGEAQKGRLGNTAEAGRGGGGPAPCPSPSRRDFRGAAPPPQVAVQVPKLALKPYSPGFKSKFCTLLAASQSPHLDPGV